MPAHLPQVASYSSNVPLLVTKEDATATKKGAKSTVIEDRPLVYHGDLKKYVCATILALKENNKLLLNKDGVANGTIEIQWSGDKAGTVFLMNFHVTNVEYSQSQDNAYPAMMFEAPDSYSNLATALERGKIGNFLLIFLVNHFC